MLAASRISESLQHTSITSEQVKTLISPPIYVASAPMFVYPSRLISAWEPRTIQVDLPKETKQGVEVKVAIRRGSTQSLGIDSRNILKQFYKQFTAPIDLGEEYIHDYRYETDGNIAHLLTIAAARVLFIQKTFPNIDRVTVVLRENASTMAKKVFGLLGIPVLCTDRDVKGNLVTFKETTSGSLEGFYTEFFGNLAFDGYIQDTPERVFISRKGKRSLINEVDVEAVLKEYGFVKYYYEDIPISQQWSISRNAKVIVAMHGAALASLAFNPNHVKVLEFFHPGYVVDMYRNTVGAIDGTWCGAIGRIEPDVIKYLDYKKQARHFALSRTQIDLDCLRMGLEHLGIEKS